MVANRKCLHTILSKLKDRESFSNEIGDDAKEYFKNRDELQAANTKRDKIAKQFLGIYRRELIEAYRDACLMGGINGYWFSDQDIKLLEHLFNKRVVSYIGDGIIACAPEGLQGELVVIHNSDQVHYSRCESTEVGSTSSASTPPLSVSQPAIAAARPITLPTPTASSLDVKGRAS